MERAAKAAEALLEAIRYFADADTCLRFVVGLRWANGIVCPRCNADGPSFLSTRRIWKCKGCKKQFSVKVGTIFEDSPLGLDKWLPALWMIANCTNGISSYELARALDVTQKTAWFMLRRIRLAMQCESFGKFGGSVEVDETFIGGKARLMHKAGHARKITRTGGAGKVAVMGLLERHGSDGHSRVRLSVLKSTKKAELQGHVRANVEVGSEVFSDALKSCDGLTAEFIHGFVDHAGAYVRGSVHTNGHENFWSLLKRSIRGTYVSVGPLQLFRYLDEQSYRFNNGKDGDRGRFLEVLRSSIGRRVTYKALTGADASGGGVE